jgi:predicted nucleic acid-binding protein
MKIFLDANILISVLNKEFPLANYTTRLLSVAASKRIKLYTSTICLAIAYYFCSKKYNATIAREKILLLASNIHLALSKEGDIAFIANNKRIEDFEDGLQYCAALNAGCTCIVTEDNNDFYFSEIEVLNTENFLDKYIFKF